MANRNSVQRLIPGNELGSVLRETAREARRSKRGEEGPGCCDDVETLQDTVASLQAQLDAFGKGHPRQYTTRLVTSGGGFINWTYPAPFTTTPRLYATVVDGSPRFVSIYLPNNTSTQCVVWDFTGSGVNGVAVNILAISAD